MAHSNGNMEFVGYASNAHCNSMNIAVYRITGGGHVRQAENVETGKVVYSETMTPAQIAEWIGEDGELQQFYSVSGLCRKLTEYDELAELEAEARRYGK